MSKTGATYARSLKNLARVYIIILILIIIGELLIAPLFFAKVSVYKQNEMIEYATNAWNFGLNYINYYGINLDSFLLTDLASLQNKPLREITPMNFSLKLKTDILGETTVIIKDNVFTFIDDNHVGRYFSVTFYANDQLGTSHPFDIGMSLKYAALFIIADIIFIISIIDIKREMKKMS